MMDIRAGILWLVSVTSAHACFPAGIESHAQPVALNYMPVLSDGLQEGLLLAFDEDVGAALALAPGAGAAVDDLGDLIAFCRPRAWTAKTCFCSVEWIETLITADAFILQMRRRRAVGAASAAELSAAIKTADEACSERVDVAPLEAPGAAARQVEPSPAWRQTGAVRSSRARAP